MITEIHLHRPGENWRSVKMTNSGFKNNLFALLGEMGSGKSTVLQMTYRLIYALKNIESRQEAMEIEGEDLRFSDIGHEYPLFNYSIAIKLEYPTLKGVTHPLWLFYAANEVDYVVIQSWFKSNDLVLGDRVFDDDQPMVIIWTQIEDYGAYIRMVDVVLLSLDEIYMHITDMGLNRLEHSWTNYPHYMRFAPGSLERVAEAFNLAFKLTESNSLSLKNNRIEINHRWTPMQKRVFMFLVAALAIHSEEYGTTTIFLIDDSWILPAEIEEAIMESLKDRVEALDGQIIATTQHRRLMGINARYESIDLKD